MKLHTQQPPSQMAAHLLRRADQKRRVGELVRMIDELSGEMGSAAFRDAVRLLGYDIDADLGMLLRRGVDRMN